MAEAFGNGDYQHLFRRGRCGKDKACNAGGEQTNGQNFHPFRNSWFHKEID
jgi:hypothetical protein